MVLATDLATALDPVLLARRCAIEPDPWQCGVLRSPAPRLLLNCCRQSGKSTVTAILATHTALYQPGSLTLLLSPSERQSKELFRKVTAAYGAAGKSVPSNSETTLWLELEHGSRIVALPGKEGTIRGFSGVDLLVIDEASRVADDLYRAIRPMLAVSGGRLIAVSTPFGKRGWWFEAWTAGGADWERVEIPATQCRRISAAFLAEERRTLGEWWVAQEYECRFMETVDQMYTHEQIQGMLADAPLPLELPL